MLNKKIPVLVLAFNRADHVAQAMQAIREYQPDRLYLECDGPRNDKVGEIEVVEATRQAMLNAIDWPCEIKTLFREENLGCAHAVYGAICWFFQNEEYGIICEDDVIIGTDFFRFCEELLPRYANEDKILSISAQNHSSRTDIQNSYVYSYRQNCWGWASWARAWQKMDMAMSGVPNLSYSFFLKRFGLVESIIRMRWYTSAYKHLDTFNSWASRWFLSVLVNNGLVIVPGVNLAVNIGTGGGTHYHKGDINPYADLEIGKMEWPLQYNDSLVVEKEQAKYDSDDYLRLKKIGVLKRIRKLLHLKCKKGLIRS